MEIYARTSTWYINDVESLYCLPFLWVNFCLACWKHWSINLALSPTYWTVASSAWLSVRPPSVDCCSLEDPWVCKRLRRLLCIVLSWFESQHGHRMPSNPAKNHSHSDMVVILIAFHSTVLCASLKPFFMNLSLIVSLFDPRPVMDKAIKQPYL